MKNTVRKIPESVEYQVGKTSTACDTAWAAQLISKVGTPVFFECIQWFFGFQILKRPDILATGKWERFDTIFVAQSLFRKTVVDFSDINLNLKGEIYANNFKKN